MCNVPYTKPLDFYTISFQNVSFVIKLPNVRNSVFTELILIIFYDTGSFIWWHLCKYRYCRHASFVCCYITYAQLFSNWPCCPVMSCFRWMSQYFPIYDNMGQYLFYWNWIIVRERKIWLRWDSNPQDQLPPGHSNPPSTCTFQPLRSRVKHPPESIYPTQTTLLFY